MVSSAVVTLRMVSAQLMLIISSKKKSEITNITSDKPPVMSPIADISNNQTDTHTYYSLEFVPEQKIIKCAAHDNFIMKNGKKRDPCNREVKTGQYCDYHIKFPHKGMPTYVEKVEPVEKPVEKPIDIINDYPMCKWCKSQPLAPDSNSMCKNCLDQEANKVLQCEAERISKRSNITIDEAKQRLIAKELADKPFNDILSKALIECHKAKSPPAAFGATIKKVVADMAKLLPKSLIRDDNGIYAYDLIKIDTIRAKPLAKLIKQLFAYVFNDSDSFYAMKSKRTIYFKDGPVDVIEYKRVASKALLSNYICIQEGEYKSQVSLLLVLEEVKKSIMYSNADVIPYSPKKTIDIGDTFNLFGQYQHKYDPNFMIDESITNKWVNHIKIVLGDNDPVLGDYLLNWFAHLLQFPERKTGTVPLIKGITRCGKNLPFNIFQRYVINPSLSITCADMEKVFGRFNSIQQGKLLIVLDEALDCKNRAMNQRIKNAITEETNQIEQKGKDIIEVQNFCNFAILTNNDFSSIIEKNDARYICIEANGEKKGDKTYFKDLVDTCANTNAGKHLFHWLLKRDLSNFYPDEIPETKYKKLLKTKQACTVVRWMISKYEELSDNDHTTEISLTPSKWFEAYQTWCVGAGERNILSKERVGSIMEENGFKIAVKTVTNKETGKRASTRTRTLSVELLQKNLEQYI